METAVHGKIDGRAGDDVFNLAVPVKCGIHRVGPASNGGASDGPTSGTRVSSDASLRGRPSRRRFPRLRRRWHRPLLRRHPCHAAGSAPELTRAAATGAYAGAAAELTPPLPPELTPPLPPEVAPPLPPELGPLLPRCRRSLRPGCPTPVRSWVGSSAVPHPESTQTEPHKKNAKTSAHGPPHCGERARIVGDTEGNRTRSTLEDGCSLRHYLAESGLLSPRRAGYFHDGPIVEGPTWRRVKLTWNFTVCSYTLQCAGGGGTGGGAGGGAEGRRDPGGGAGEPGGMGGAMPETLGGAAPAAQRMVTDCGL